VHVMEEAEKRFDAFVMANATPCAKPSSFA
jgi:hypothetical protein